MTANNGKLDFRLEHALATAKDQGEFSLTVLFRTNAPMQTSNEDVIGQNGQPIPGVKLRTNIMNTIFTANASPDGARALISEPAVVSIQGAMTGPIQP